MKVVVGVPGRVDTLAKVVVGVSGRVDTPGAKVVRGLPGRVDTLAKSGWGVLGSVTFHMEWSGSALMVQPWSGGCAPVKVAASGE